jgi:hypothetical protein
MYFHHVAMLCRVIQGSKYIGLSILGTSVVSRLDNHMYFDYVASLCTFVLGSKYIVLSILGTSDGPKMDNLMYSDHVDSLSVEFNPCCCLVPLW